MQGIVSFGQNGAVLDDMQDEQLRLELRDRKRFHAWYPAILFGVLSLAFVVNEHIDVARFDPGIFIPVFCVILGSVLAPSLVSHAQYAIDDFKLPQRFGGGPKHDHVSGGAVLFAALALTIVASVLRVLDGVEGELVMRGRIGLLVVFVIAAAFIVFILSPRLISSTSVIAIGRLWSQTKSQKFFPSDWLNYIGRAVSIFDSWLVHIIAPSVGVSLKADGDRYGILTLYLTACGFLAWHFPAPFGLLPAGLWFVISISVARRWAWIEDDREVTLRRPKYDEAELRVGVREDLRDEALLALLSLILLLPLAMRQIHLGSGGQLFAINTDGQFIDSLWTWLSFFGLELAKAVPFVDWADIYNVETEFVISAETMSAHHVVFFARAIVDLVFLSALLQAISISLKLSRHKRMFFNKEINLLDPMIEAIEFSKLAYRDNGVWRVGPDVERFKHYDPVALARIRVRNNPASALYAVAAGIRELQDDSVSPASERFLEKVCARPPMRKDVEAAWRFAQRNDDMPIEFLVLARSMLNNKPVFNELREKIARQLIGKPVSVERNKALRSILAGDDQDSIREIRMLAINPLKASAPWDLFNQKALKSAANSDRSRLVRRTAAAALRELDELAPARSLYSPSNSKVQRRQDRTIPVLGEID